MRIPPGIEEANYKQAEILSPELEAVRMLQSGVSPSGKGLPYERKGVHAYLGNQWNRLAETDSFPLIPPFCNRTLDCIYLGMLPVEQQ